MLNFCNVAVAVLLPVAAFLAHWGGGISSVLALFQTRSERVQIKEEQELSDHLEVVMSDIHRRIEIKNALIAELISGRTTLVEVTKQVLILNQSRPDCMTILRASYPGNNNEEKTAYNVMAYTRVNLSDAKGAQQAEVLTRLKIEFKLAYPANSAGTFPGNHPQAGKEANSREDS